MKDGNEAVKGDSGAGHRGLRTGLTSMGGGWGRQRTHAAEPAWERRRSW